MTAPVRSTARRYLVALLSFAATAALRLALVPYLGSDAPYGLFFPAAMIAAGYGGLGPALLVMGATIAFVQLVLLPLPHGIPLGYHDITAVGLFLLVGFVIALGARSLERARQRTQDALDALQQERRDSAIALRETEVRFRILADHAPVLIWMSGTDGLCDWFNEPWLLFRGRTMEQEAGNGWAEGVHADDLERCLSTYRTSFVARRPFSMEYRLRRHDGEYRWILDDGVPRFDAAGAFTGYIGSCLDITERRAEQEQREALLARERDARHQAELAGRLKDEFLATLSHELRTPLNAVLGWTQILRSGRARPGDLERGLEVIERNVKVQVQLISDLLEMSRILSGKLALELGTVDFPSLAAATVDSLRPSAEQRQIRLASALDADAGPVLGDPARLQQVLSNLLSNAIKFTPSGGRIEVELARREPWAELTVRDSGEGIDPAFLPHIFERFRQADASTTRAHGGLGLGLAIVRQLVEMHGGQVSAASEGRGRGATFTVRVPLSASPVLPAERPAPAPDRTALRGLDVLLVDDDADAREVVGRLLRERGAEVRPAGSAAEALARCAERMPDALVSDIAMPGQDGHGLVRALRALPDERGRGVPAIAVTAYARDEDRHRALVAGFDAHLGKPVDGAALAALIQSLVARRTSRH